MDWVNALVRNLGAKLNPENVFRKSLLLAFQNAAIFLIRIGGQIGNNVSVCVGVWGYWGVIVCERVWSKL